jgi:hypothetical protein
MPDESTPAQEERDWAHEAGPCGIGAQIKRLLYRELRAVLKTNLGGRTLYVCDGPIQE